MTVVRTIECYDKKTEELVHEFIIPTEITPEQLYQGLTHFDLSDDPELCLGYPITEKNNEILSKITRIDIPYKQYDCFLAVYEENH
jgi:hypothetical protein